ncbi:MAG: alkaline phosphatase family protein [Dehalococcoidia bacterium]
MVTTNQRQALLMIWDGLRPDMITPERTPHLARLAAEGTRFTDSHAVIPTVTRCNSASIATGALPSSHGIPGNTFYAPAVDPTQALTAGNAAALRAWAKVRGGPLLDRPTLADRVHRAGGRSAIVSTGSTGSAFLQHPNVDACGDLLFNPSIWAGMSQEDVEARIGAMPPGSMPNTEQNAWFTRLITDILLPEVKPRFISFWHTDPDRTQHDCGIGQPETLRSLGDADRNLGAMLTALERLDLRGSTDVVVTSDHGFSTIIGHVDVSDALIRAGLKDSTDSVDVVVTGGAIYVPGSDSTRIGRIVQVLQELKGVGPIFRNVRGARLEGTGTLPLGCVGVDGALAPDVLYSNDWSNEANEYGHPGSAWSGPTSKAATHGSISPWDVRNSLVAAGPSFKHGLVSAVPAGNVDITPTLLHTLGLPLTDDLDGRLLSEALVDGPSPDSITVDRSVLAAESEHGRFKQWVQISKVDRTRYVDFGWVER